MRITAGHFIIMLILTGVSYAETSKAQSALDQRITLRFQNIPLKEALTQIENSTAIKFIYSLDFVQLDQTVSLVADREKLVTILDQLLKPLQIQYQAVNDRIVLKKPKVKTQSGIGLRGDDQSSAVFTVTGRVTDDQNQGLPGVTVLLKGTTTGTATGSEGTYSLTLPDDAVTGTLVFSSIGYVTQEVPVNNRTTIDLSLVPDIKSLGEVVVVGYGTQRRKDVTGSIASVSEREIKATPITSLDQALSGRAPGVQVTQASSAPGGAVSIRIRGGNSINGGTEPLYVIDGVPINSNNGTYAPGGREELGQASNALATISPNDIESIEILKDASATAIYGSRGANGVVIITTKRGKAGQTNVDFEMYQGMQYLSKKIDVMNAREYANYYNALVLSRNPLNPNEKLISEEQIAAFGEGTDWQEELFRPAPMSNYQLTFSGGTEKTRYTLSGNYFTQDGLVTNSDFKRYSLRLNLDQQVSSKFRVGNSLTVSRTTNNSILTESAGNDRRGPVYNALVTPPLIPVRDANGNYTNILAYGRDVLGLNPTMPNVENPIAMAEQIKNLVTTTRLLGNVFAEYDIIPGLTARVSFGADISDARRSNYFPSTLIGGFASVRGIGTLSYSQVFNWLNENLLTYSKTFNQIHALNVTGLVSFQEQTVERSLVSTSNFPNDITGYNNLGAGSVRLASSSSAGRWALASYMVRVNYSLMDKYLFTVAARTDGSSRWGAGNKYGFFPSGAVAWRVSEEEFMKNVPYLSDLKVRTSYGVTGNSEIGEYQSLALIGSGGGGNNYVFNGVEATGSAPNRIPNPDLRWEKTAQWDLGMDIGLFNNRLNLTADYYIKITRDLLLAKNIPTETGYASSLQNVGSLENRGLELGLNTQNTVGSFGWSTSANISFNRNKVLNIGDNPFLAVGDATGFLLSQPRNSGILKVGVPVGNFYGAVLDGIWQSQEEINAANAADGNPNTPYQSASTKPGDRRFRDLDGNGVFEYATEKDKTIIGDSNPDFIYGFTNNFSFKGFELSVFIQGSYGNDVLNLTRIKLETDFLGRENKTTRVVDAWNPADPDPNTQIFAVGRNQDRYLISSYVEDGSYLRVKNVNLGYNIPVSKYIKWFRSAKVYVSAQNLLTFTRYSGYDPEVNAFGQSTLSRGIDMNSYPAARIFLAGINIGL